MFALTAPNGRPAPAPVLSQMERISSATGKPTEAATAAALPRAIFGRRTGQPDAVRRRDQYVESDCDQFPGGSSYELERRNVRTEPRLQLLSDLSPICPVKSMTTDPTSRVVPATRIERLGVPAFRSNSRRRVKKWRGFVSAEAGDRAVACLLDWNKIQGIGFGRSEVAPITFIPHSLSDARIPTTEPRLVVGARAVIRGFVTVIDRCTVSGASYPPKRPLGITQIPGRRPTWPAARGRCCRDQSPKSRRSQERNRCGCTNQGIVTRPICDHPQ